MYYRWYVSEYYRILADNQDNQLISRVLNITWLVLENLVSYSNMLQRCTGNIANYLIRTQRYKIKPFSYLVLLECIKYFKVRYSPKSCTKWLEFVKICAHTENKRYFIPMAKSDCTYMSLIEHFYTHESLKWAALLLNRNFIMTWINCWYGQLFWSKQPISFLLLLKSIKMFSGSSKSKVRYIHPYRDLTIQTHQEKYIHSCTTRRIFLCDF